MKKTTKQPATATATEKTPKTSQNAKETTSRRIKLNSERFAEYKYQETNRSMTEETEQKPRLTHEPRGKKESDGYFGTRRLAFALTKSEFRTPQNNIELIRNAINAKLPKDKKLTERMNYSARDFALKFFPSDRNGFVLIDVRKEWTIDGILKHIG